MSVVSLFDLNVTSNPDAVALVGSEGCMSYSQLDLISNKWANYMSSLCSVTDMTDKPKVAAICLGRSFDQVIAALCVMKQGWAYMPIDPTHPDDRIRTMIENSAPAVLFTTLNLRPKLEAVVRVLESPPIIIEIDDTLLIENCSEKYVPETISGDSSAYIIHTSGSTGVPKGVDIAHAGLANLAHFQERLFSLCAGKVVLAFSNFIFDASVWEIFSALCSGAALCIVDKQAVIPGQALIDTINQYAITHLTLPPSVLSVLPYTHFEKLEVLVTAGEACGSHIKEVWGGDQLKLYNAYGPTEATVCASIMPVSKTDEIIHLGQAIDGMTIFVLNDKQQPVETGETGEIYISGVSLAKGYVNNPDETVRSFVSLNGVGGDEETLRCYKTGDLASIDEQGRIIFKGRADSQIKHSGYRIDLGEIESVLSRQKSVVNCAVAYQMVKDRLEIVAYFITQESDGGRVESELKQALKRVVPEYMLPSRWVSLNEFPMTQNGKIDRSKLCVPDDLLASSSSLSETGEVELKLIDIFKEVLNVAAVSSTDDFFDLGGHSLLVVQVIMLIKQRCGVSISIADFFDGSTVTNIASLVKAGVKEDDDRIAMPIERNDMDSPFPLTEIQQAYYLGRSGYFELSDVSTNVYREFYFKELDVSRLQSSLNKMVGRHGMLRCHFIDASSQQVSPSVPDIEISITDKSAISSSEAGDYLQSVRSRMSISKLDASKAPLLSVMVTRFSNTWCVHIVIDALIMDGWSYYQFFSELGRYYLDINTSLPVLDTTFQEYVLALEAEKETQSYRAAKEYWFNRVGSLPFGPNLPLKKQPKEIKNQAVKSLSFSLDKLSWAKMKEFISSNGWRDTTFLLSVFAEIVGLWSSSHHFTLCLTLFNRHPIGKNVNNLIGVFTTLVLLESKLSSESFLETIKNIQTQLFEDLDHRQYSGVSVQKDHRAHHAYAAEGTMTPVVFTSFLAAQEIIAEDNIFHDKNCLYTSTQTSQVWLDAKAFEVSGNLVLEWDYIEDLFPEGMVQDMFSAFCQVVESLAESHSLVSEPLCVSKEIEESYTPIEESMCGLGGTLIDRFEHSVAESSDQVAVISHDGRISYAELDRKSSALAYYIQKTTQVSDEVIAILLPPSVYQSISMVGILKAGLAYLPLDPAQPDSRLSYMLSQAGVRSVVTFPEFQGRLEKIGWYTDCANPAIIPLGPTGVDLGQGGDFARVNVSADSLAYVIYTSGSTGLPKGVMITHAAVINTLDDMNTAFEITEESVVLSVSNYSFDLSVYDYWGTFLARGSVVTISPGSEKDPACWLELIKEHNVTVWNSVPMLAKMLVTYFKLHPQSFTLDTISLYLLSGDWVQRSLASQIKACYKKERKLEIVSLGGATECSIWSILHIINPGDCQKKTIPYGSSMQGQTVMVLNDRYQLCPTFVRGDIYIAGVGLSLGYINNKQQTDRQFIQHPQSGIRLYKTGDLGCFLPNGEIEFLGREDGQVKIGGHRVELGEINYQIEQLAGISAAYSLILDVSGAQVIVAFYVLDKDCGKTYDQADLRSKINTVLPGYMQPQLYMALKKIPLSNNGKVDFNQLQEMASLNYDRFSHAVDEGDVDSRLLAIWKNVLNLKSIPCQADFFSVGGDSLKLIQLMAEINKISLVSFTMPDLISNRTLADQTALLSLGVISSGEEMVC
jgi:amino acid adenylation domain-containing protein